MMKSEMEIGKLSFGILWHFRYQKFVTNWSCLFKVVWIIFLLGGYHYLLFSLQLFEAEY